MKKITNALQHPFLKIFISPLAFVAFGTIVGIISISRVSWIALVCLVLFVIATQLIDHYFDLQYNRGTPMASGILYTCEAVMMIAFVYLAFTHHWTVGVILFLYGAMIHLCYFPYLLSGTYYQLILQIVYHGIFLQMVAHYTQTTVVEQSLIHACIPIALYMAGGLLEVFHLQSQLRVYQGGQVIHSHLLNLLLMAAGIIFGAFLSFPSKFYFLPQIAYILITALFTLPLLVRTQSEHQKQNKINYIYATQFIFTVCYALSYAY